MPILIIGLILFFGVHSLQIVKPDIRRNVIARYRNERAWLIPYALLAAAGLVLMIYGYGQARQSASILYAPPVGMRHLAMLLLLPIFVLLIATYLPGRIKATVRHPMLIAVLLWGVAHLLVNGSWADILLFGSFTVWAAADLVSVVRRKAEPSHVLKPAARNDWIALIVGLLIYVGFITRLHQWITGVPVM